MKLYDFKVKDNKNETVSLDKYQDKVVMIVNSATKCGLTPQYEQLQALYLKYKDQGFEILDFPSNQFLKQSPLEDNEIQEFCTLNYQTTFDRFKKIDVNGSEASPLYVWLKEQKKEGISDEQSLKFEKSVKIFTIGNKPSDIKWNFTKFLIDRNGNVASRFSPSYDIKNIEVEIEKLLENK